MKRRTARLLTTFAFALLAQLLQNAAQAQVAVLRVDPEAEPLCAALEAALADADLIADPGYFAEAQQQGVDPSSDAALELIVPLLGVQLAVVPQSADARAAQVEFRDGRTGARTGTAAIPLAGGAVGWQGRQVLRREVFARLGAPPSGGSEANAAPEAMGGEIDEASEESDEPALRVRVFAGAGVGTRDLDWVQDGEPVAVETGGFGAVDVGASFELAASDALRIGPQFAYQTSLGHEITEPHIAGPAETMRVRAHRFEGVLAATFDIGKGRNFQIAPALGYGVRNLRPEVHHLLTPSYSLHGPVAKLAARLRVGDIVALRLAPEAQYLWAGTELQERGLADTGLGLGGEAAVELVLSSSFGLELSFRQAHALLQSADGKSASDVERFVTARVVATP